jgi:hypothetical protein
VCFRSHWHALAARRSQLLAPSPLNERWDHSEARAVKFQAAGRSGEGYASSYASIRAFCGGRRPDPAGWSGGSRRSCPFLFQKLHQLSGFQHGEARQLVHQLRQISDCMGRSGQWWWTDYPDHDPRRSVFENFLFEQFAVPTEWFLTGLHEIDDNLVVLGQDVRIDFDKVSEVGRIAYCPDACTVSGVCPEVFCSLECACQWLPRLFQNYLAEALAVEIALFVIAEMGVPAWLGARGKDEKFEKFAFGEAFDHNVSQRPELSRIATAYRYSPGMSG